MTEGKNVHVLLLSSPFIIPTRFNSSSAYVSSDSMWFNICVHANQVELILNRIRNIIRDLSIQVLMKWYLLAIKVTKSIERRYNVYVPITRWKNGTRRPSDSIVSQRNDFSSFQSWSIPTTRSAKIPRWLNTPLHPPPPAWSGLYWLLYRTTALLLWLYSSPSSLATLYTLPPLLDPSPPLLLFPVVSRESHRLEAGTVEPLFCLSRETEPGSSAAPTMRKQRRF